MSLNKLTTSSDYLEKQYLNIGCNDIKCSSLEIKGQSVKGSIAGQYTPVITVDDGSSINTVFGNYIIIGDDTDAMVDLSVSCKMINSTATSLYQFSVQLPLGYTAIASAVTPCVGYIHNRGGAYSNYLVQECSALSGQNSITLYFNEISATQLPVGIGENFVQFSLKVKCQK
jgi:hypothetical protein